MRRSLGEERSKAEAVGAIVGAPQIVLPGGTKEGLTMLPAFEYAKQ